MRALLMTVMLIITVIAIYQSTIGGDNGAKASVKKRGQTINSAIENINP